MLNEKDKNRLFALFLRVLGFRICSFFLGIFIKPFFNIQKRNKNFNHGDIKKILLIKMGNLGDIINLIPSIIALDNKFKNAKISLVASSEWKEIIKNIPQIDKFIAFKTPSLDIERENSISYIKGFLEKIRKDRYDLGIEFRGDFHTLFYLYLSNCKFKAGYDIGFKGFLLDFPVKEDKTLQDVDRNFKIAKALGVKEYNIDNWKINVNKNDSVFINKLLKDNVDNKKPTLLISPGAPWYPRRWPLKKFIKLITKLNQADKYNIILTGSKAELNLSKKIKEKVENVFVVTGKLNLNQLILLIKRSDLYIGNDTGLAHIAAMVNTLSVIIWGPGEYPRFTPKRGGLIVRKKIDCNPCAQDYSKTVCKRGRKTCEALELIDVQYVLNAINRQIKLIKKIRG